MEMKHIFKHKSSPLAALLLAVFMLLPNAASAQQKVTLSGVVTDAADKQPVIGATVVIEGTKTGAVTDIDGKYSLQVQADATVSVECLGYVTQKIKVNGQTVINVVLASDKVALDEVVVIGYGTVTKSDLTGSVATVKMDDIAAAPVSSVDQALQGRIAGADIMATTGEPGAATSIRIRGTRSITASNEPLIVVDGVMDGVSDLSDINPSDIKSI